MSFDEESQKDELIAISSIYDDCFIGAERKIDNLNGGELYLEVDVPSGFEIYYKNTKTNVTERTSVQYLPPLVLNFSFPSNYPSEEKPNFTLSSKWLPSTKLSALCVELDRLWEEGKGSEIMFTWAQFLKDESLNFLDIKDSLEILKRPKTTPGILWPSEDFRGIQDFSPDLNLFSYLRDYNEDATIKAFKSRSYECKVCFIEKSGQHCTQFWPCCHTFCNDCMKSYFEVQIKDGNIKCLKCPEEKCNSDANPKQVENLVSKELYEKWDKMLLSCTLSSLEDIQLCPRFHCQYPVTIEENMGRCPVCGFVFCGICRFGYHGVEKCRIKNEEAKKVIAEYQNGTPEVKESLEKRYGKRRLKILVDELMSLSYITDNFKKCPKCSTDIEKVDGCNKMACNRCGSNFCWLCGTIISKQTPYSHFNDKNSDCFNRLFQGVEMEPDYFDDDDDDDDFLYGGWY